MRPLNFGAPYKCPYPYLSLSKPAGVWSDKVTTDQPVTKPFQFAEERGIIGSRQHI